MIDSDTAIRVEGLGKRYALHHEKAERYTALRDVVARQAKAAVRLINPFTLAGQLSKAQRQAAESSEEEFWALKDVSFEIRRGERVGIIGRNGAGKSTLLKILSRITEPTTGRVEIRGRVASLLEVGTGFHPELTGLENIYLNGAILGMTRQEIRSKFDEIVDFAEVEKFLDTPVKRYSSGMYVRLAFAVAAHLEPEILVVDEVLAVGDAGFQKKCLGKMEDVSDTQGRTVLFVSHQMNAITRMCSRAILLANGRLILDTNETKKAVSRYYGGEENNCQSTWKNIDKRYRSREVIPISFSIESSSPRSEGISAFFENSRMLKVKMCFEAKNIDDSMNVGIAVYACSGELLLWSFSSDADRDSWPKIVNGINRLCVSLPSHFFNEGVYTVEFLASFHMRKFIIAPGEGPQVSFTIKGGLSMSPHWIRARPGLLAPIWAWRSYKS